jgi:hypothetical protein
LSQLETGSSAVPNTPFYTHRILTTLWAHLFKMNMQICALTDSFLPNFTPSSYDHYKMVFGVCTLHEKIIIWAQSLLALLDFLIMDQGNSIFAFWFGNAPNKILEAVLIHHFFFGPGEIPPFTSFKNQQSLYLFFTCAIRIHKINTKNQVRLAHDK